MNKFAWKSQKGLSFVELMVALTVGLFIVVGMIALFVNAKASYRLNDNMARLQENARFAVSFISRDVRMADYRTCVTNELLTDAVSGQDNAGLNGSDTVTLLWQSNDCGAASSLVTTTYSIQNGSSGSPALFRSIDGVSQELVEGIEDLQILYGQDTDNDNVPNYFVDAASITNMAEAITMRFTLIARTLDENLTPDGDGISRAFTFTVALRNRLP